MKAAAPGPEPPADAGAGPPFADRAAAGRVLAGRLAGYGGRPDVVVLGLPRGGVPVAFEVARALAAPLDVFSVRKLGVPGREELAMGAIASGGVRVLNPDVVSRLDIPAAVVDEVAAAQQTELARRELAYRGDRRPLELGGRLVVVVDDGLATGSTMRAAVAAVRRHRPALVVVAVPTGALASCRLLESEADAVVCASTPDPFYAVGLAYRDFSQTSEDTVRDLLSRAAAERGPGPPATGEGDG